jgi:hypothetical protein
MGGKWTLLYTSPELLGELARKDQVEDFNVLLLFFFEVLVGLHD